MTPGLAAKASLCVWTAKIRQTAYTAPRAISSRLHCAQVMLANGDVVDPQRENRRGSAAV